MNRICQPALNVFTFGQAISVVAPLRARARIFNLDHETNFSRPEQVAHRYDKQSAETHGVLILLALRPSSMVVR
jgi:hypothetical protein